MTDTILYLRSSVQFENANANVFEIAFYATEKEIPSGFLRQDDGQLAGAQIDTGTGDGFGTVANEDVRPQRVVHVVPARE